MRECTVTVRRRKPVEAAEAYATPQNLVGCVNDNDHDVAMSSTPRAVRFSPSVVERLRRYLRARPGPSASALTSRFIDEALRIAVVTESELGTLPDHQILEWATAAGRCLVTENVKDFEVLRRAAAADGRTHAGLVHSSPGQFPRDRRFVGTLVAALDLLPTGGRVPEPNMVCWLTPARRRRVSPSWRRLCAGTRPIRLGAGSEELSEAGSKTTRPRTKEAAMSRFRPARSRAAMLLLTGAVLVGTALASVGPIAASASSHREAPLISGQPHDNTDAYSSAEQIRHLSSSMSAAH
jgi:hypothetical protein